MRSTADLRSLALFTIAAALASCAPLGPETTEPGIEDLTVCHTTVVEGIDVASFQGAIDWPTVHASGREFAIARIGDGTFHDSTFATNWAGIQAAGMIRGAYLFFRPTVSAATQAAAIDAAVGVLGDGDLPVTIDVECMCPFMSSGACGSGSASSCVSPSAANAVLTDLVAMVAASTGKTPMIYTGTWFWDGSSYLASASSFPGNALWVSGYTSGCVSVPSGWSDWQFWQYSDGSCSGCVTAPVPGVPAGGGSDVNRNRFNGTLADLRAFAGGGGTTTPIYGASYVAQSFPLTSVGTLQIMAGDSVAASIDLRNSGTATWDENTRLATTVPRDRDGLFPGADWVGPNRPAGVAAGMTVAPGATYHFTWTWTVPAGTAPGMYDEHFGMVEEGMVWFSDPGEGGPPDNDIEVIIEVLPGVDTGVPPEPDAAVVGDDAATPGVDAGTPASDASRRDGSMSSGGDAGVSMSRGISGGCGCRAGGARPSSGSIALVGFVLALVARRRRRG